MKKLLILLAIFTTFATMAQSVGINADGSTADASAMLDVSSTTKGFLPPRMTTTERNAIGTPATGLVIFNTTTNGLEFKSSTGWTSLTTGTITASGLAVSGDVAVNTNKFTVTAANGNTAVAGTLAVTGESTLNSLTLNGTLTVGGSSLSFASYTSTGTTINSGNHIVSGTGITLELNTSPSPTPGTFCIIYNPSNSYSLSQNGTSSIISANNTTVCIYSGTVWVAYSNGVTVTFN